MAIFDYLTKLAPTIFDVLTQNQKFILDLNADIIVPNWRDELMAIGHYHPDIVYTV